MNDEGHVAGVFRADVDCVSGAIDLAQQARLAVILVADVGFLVPVHAEHVERTDLYTKVAANTQVLIHFFNCHYSLSSTCIVMTQVLHGSTTRRCARLQ